MYFFKVNTPYHFHLFINFIEIILTQCFFRYAKGSITIFLSIVNCAKVYTISVGTAWKQPVIPVTIDLLDSTS